MADPIRVILSLGLLFSWCGMGLQSLVRAHPTRNNDIQDTTCPGNAKPRTHARTHVARTSRTHAHTHALALVALGWYVTSGRCSRIPVRVRVPTAPLTTTTPACAPVAVATAEPSRGSVDVDLEDFVPLSN
eukprot:6189616-Amphidinium_carterae.1